MVLIRSLIFTCVFYIFTAVSVFWYGILCSYIDRKTLIQKVHLYMQRLHWLEKHILGLDYEVRGLENLPSDNKFILASKHQSTYETMKLHLLLGDPAVILKKELTEIPLWGAVAKKTDQIAIDRSSREQAMASIKAGVKNMMDQDRPIVIYPQGTRVSIHDTPKQKPYKFGVARIYKDTNLPVVPMALNTGVFWPRHSLIKKPGKVIFEFLPIIPAGLKQDVLMRRLQESIEKGSDKLVQEALSK